MRFISSKEILFPSRSLLRRQDTGSVHLRQSRKAQSPGSYHVSLNTYTYIIR